MTEANLSDEVERLVRPCVLLGRTPAPGGVAAIWGGPGVVPSPSTPARHWLSIDCRFLPAGLGPASGVLSIYTFHGGRERGAAVHDSRAVLPPVADGALYARPARSLPPPDTLPGTETADYVRTWQAVCPLYTGEAAAVLGGWHFPWPDDDWEELRERPLLVWTLEESEPWVEVWGDGPGFQIIPRIT